MQLVVLDRIIKVALLKNPDADVSCSIAAVQLAKIKLLPERVFTSYKL